jgi:hypothetical protein
VVKKLRGVTFNWKKDDTPSTGVIAQDIEKVVPSAVTTDPKTGLKSVEYSQLIAPLIESVKDIASLSDPFKQSLINWLGSASIGISDLFGHIGHFDETDTQKLCIGSGTTKTCITQQAARRPPRKPGNPQNPVGSLHHFLIPRGSPSPY